MNSFSAHSVFWNAGALQTYQKHKQTLGFLVFLLFFSLPPFIMAAHLSAATGSMAVIECNWNSNWIADIGEGRREGLAVRYNSITKLSHYFRTQTNKVKQWGCGGGGGGVAYRNLDASTPRKLFFPSHQTVIPSEEEKKNPEFYACVCVRAHAPLILV